MNIASPQEQFASRKRLDALFRAPARPMAVREIPSSPVVSPAEAKPKRKYWLKADTIQWFGDRCPWPCYAGSNICVSFERPEIKERVSVRDIILFVAREYQISEVEILSHRRTAPLALIRHIAMYLAKTCTCKSYPQIGRQFGGRDHTTILHGVKKIELLIADSEEFAAEVNSLHTRLEDGN